MTTEELFSNGENPSNKEPEIDDAKQYLPELVGEGKKFKDLEDLAKGKVKSDSFIEQLKRENAELRESLNTAKSVEEHLNDLRSAVIERSKREENIREMTPSDLGSDGNNPQDPSAKNVPSPEDIQRIVSEEVDRRVSAQKREQNLDSVTAAAKAVHGDNYKQALTDKAKELQSSPSELFKIAEANPELFKRIMGLTQTTQSENTSQNSASRIFDSVNTEALRNRDSGPGTPGKRYSDFQKMRRENPKAYFSPQVQNEIFALAEKHGPDYFNT